MRLSRPLTLAALLSCALATGAPATCSQAVNEPHSSSNHESEIRERPSPNSDPKGKGAAWEGDIIIRVLLRADGKVGDISILKGGPRELNKAVVKAAKRIKFTPAEKGGHAVSQWATLKYTFARSDEDQK